MDIHVLAYLLCSAAALRLLLVLYRAAASPLRSVPGPLLSRFTDGWYLWRVYLGRFNEENQHLHARYGRHPNVVALLLPAQPR